ncbi:MAG: rhodanese-like domain-containing protein [Clostridia bacterium]|nr:rhodanese-like domain-containing protein [Clostridia bacterium]
MRKIIIAAISLTLLMCGCSGGNDSTSSQVQSSAVSSQISEESVLKYRQISQSEAMDIMNNEKGIIILDVRTLDEFNAGHIPGAICVPNENIGTSDVPQLPDKSQKILVYCRSGRRSKEAAGKLADIGYTNILEFGGINDWQGAVVTGYTS